MTTSKKNTVEIYTTPSCAYCKMAKEYFENLKEDQEDASVTE